MITRFACPGYMKNGEVDDLNLRVIVMVVFFVVLVLIDRKALAGINRPPAVAIDKADFAPGKTPQETSAAMARVFAGATDDESRQRAIRDCLYSIVPLTVLIPFIFYIRFGMIGPLGWGLTVFFDVYCLLWALGLYFLPRTEYHTPVKPRGDWMDRVGAFWLVGCAFGPFFGWVVTAWPLTTSSWHWRYELRVLLAAGLPILLALPLLRYARGKSSLVGLPLLLVVTLLPVSTATGSIRDLLEGPEVRQVQRGDVELHLKYSDRVLEGVCR